MNYTITYTKANPKAYHKQGHALIRKATSSQHAIKLFRVKHPTEQIVSIDIAEFV